MATTSHDVAPIVLNKSSKPPFKSAERRDSTIVCWTETPSPSCGVMFPQLFSKDVTPEPNSAVIGFSRYGLHVRVRCRADRLIFLLVVWVQFPMYMPPGNIIDQCSETIVTGTVAKDNAGPGIVLSFLIAGFVALLSSLCYAEFAARIPKTGSAYLFGYVRWTLLGGGDLRCLFNDIFCLASRLRWGSLLGSSLHGKWSWKTW